MLDTILPPGSVKRVAAVAAACALAVLAFTQLYLAVPVGIVFTGVVLGMIASLTAAGIVLIYRSQRFVNFAQASIGVSGAIVAFNMMQFKDVPFLVAVPCGILIAAFVGLVVEFGIMKRFSKQPRLVLTVLSVGLAQGIPGASQAVLRRLFPFIFPNQKTEDLLSQLGGFTPRLPLAGLRFHIGHGGQVFGFAHLFALELAVIALLGLGAFFRFTRAGVAVRGAAENSERATLLGIGVGSLSTVVWVLAALLSGIAVIVAAPLSTVAAATSAGSGLTLLLPALAAAVLARMRSIPVAVAASVAIAVMQQSIDYARPTENSLVPVVLFAIVIVGLLLQRRAAGRTDVSEQSSWQATDEQRPIPKEMLSVAGVRLGRAGLVLVTLAAVVVFPFLASVRLTNTASVIAITGIVGVSLVALTGWAGQASLGQFGFVAIGSVVGGALITKWHVPFLLALVVVPVIVGAVAVAVGLPALRIRGLFLAVSTFAFAEAVHSVLFDDKYFGWLLPGTINRPKLFLVDFTSERNMYFLCLFCLAVSVVFITNLRRSRTGRVLIAARENEANLQSFGVNLIRAKLLGFAISGALCGFAGVLFAVQQGAVSETSFRADASVEVFLFSVLGGIGSVTGVLVGAVFRGVTHNVIHSQFLAPLVGPGGLLLILYVAPGGFISLLTQLRDNALRIVAQRRQMVVPSLFADIDPEALAARLIPLSEPQASSGLAVLRADLRFQRPSELYRNKGRPPKPPVEARRQAVATLSEGGDQ